MVLIETLYLFPKLDGKLLELLRSLTPEDWNRPTVARLWTVKDIAAHLLDGNLRNLSIARDGYMGDPPTDIESYADLVNYLNRLNAEWVKALKRLSPAVIIELLESSGQQYHEYLGSLDPAAQAIFSVGWAGEDVSPNWFHIAREYTEKWHHQQQIREAVGKPGIMNRELYHPFLQTFMMALPYTYRDVVAAPGTTVQVTITGAGGDDWFLVRDEHERWALSSSGNTQPAAHTTIDGAIAWKLFSKSWRRKEAEGYLKVEGDAALGGKVLEMVSVMA